MKIIGLQFAGIGPYVEQCSIDFAALSASGMFLIQGETGSGKSTLLDAITMALYDSVSSDFSDSSRMRSKFLAQSRKETFTDLIFEIRDKVYRVRREPQYSIPKLRGEGVTEHRASATLWQLDDDIRQLIDDVEAGVDGRIETERIVGVFKVVVDGAGDADRRDAELLAEALGAAERTVAADNDQTFDAVVVERLDRLLLPLDRVHFDAAGRTEDRAAALDDVRNAAHLHRLHFGVDQACLALLDAIDLHAEILCRTDDRTDACVHAGCVAAARQYTDSFHITPPFR